jgi:penicillin-binding protein 1A
MQHPLKPSFWRQRPRLARGVLLAFLFCFFFGTGFAVAAWTLVCRGGACPDPHQLDQMAPKQTSKLYAADGRFISEIGLERRTLVPIKEIPMNVRQAFIITEDKRFYEHRGIDMVRVFGAALHNLTTRGFGQGFSTLTMQLARNAFPEKISREKTIIRKIRETKIALEIEALYPKDKILELYLNQIYLGNGAYGVETAAQRYFGKSVRDVNLAEAAMLAALPKAPERYNPRRFPDRAIQRRNTIVGLMRNEGVISETDARLAQSYPLDLAKKSEAGELAPYFVEWVRQQLEEQFGEKLYSDGLKIFTTLDIDIQQAAERNLERQLRAIEAGKYGAWKHTTFEQYMARNTTDAETAENSPYLQGAFVAMDPRNGAVRALIGGRDFDDSKFNRATQALRQPGSTFKPVVYATAIHSGLSPSHLLDDSPITLPQFGGTDWTPQNYDLKFMGIMPLRQALYLSRNLATIRLGQELGAQSVIEMARKVGLTTTIPPYPSIFIGSADVYPLEMIAAYSAFATLGVRTAPHGIVRVENAKGQVLWEGTPLRYDVLTREEAWLMVSMMKDVLTKGSAASVGASGFSIPAAGKTGTTNDYTDVWFIGYTADLLAGVWMGFDRPQKIQANAQGGRLAAPAWTTFMSEVYNRRRKPPDWPRPEAIITRQVDDSTGMLRNPFCPVNLVVNEYYIEGTEPTKECDVHGPTATSPFDTVAVPQLRVPPSALPPPPAPRR